ncbi:MAG TPA: hypothetical protein PKV86_02905 [Syntrophobacteraceae bacterium]|nr:hypothetical protein [Syntrophobacteraceae bacterium]
MMRVNLWVLFFMRALLAVMFILPCTKLASADTEDVKTEKKMEVSILHVDKYGVYAPNLVFYWDPGMTKQKISALTGIAERLRNKEAMITYTSASDITKDKRPILVDIAPLKREAAPGAGSPVVKGPSRPSPVEEEEDSSELPTEQLRAESEEPAIPGPGEETDTVRTQEALSASAPITRAEVVRFVYNCIDGMQSKDVERSLECYGDRVDYYSKGTVNRDFIRRDKGYYFRNWDRISSSLDGDIVIIVIDQPDLRIVKFNSRFFVQNARNTVSGRAENLWTIQKVGSALKIIGEKQEIIERDSL